MGKEVHEVVNDIHRIRNREKKYIKSIRVHAKKARTQSMPSTEVIRRVRTSLKTMSREEWWGFGSSGVTRTGP